MCKDSCPLVIQGFKWDLGRCPSNPWQYKNRTWEGEVFYQLSVCKKNRDHAQHKIEADSWCLFYDIS